uniref:GAG-pre-integrase domain-containing protein n=1 Tax=Lactuca sativa TaxID=4236 RepID=A0A9R1WUW2_LACSA|nr:hypothetical protein LSAT_V11C800417220 [Lactuca sativa]
MATIAAFTQAEKTIHNSYKFGFKLSSTNYGYWKTMLQPFLVTNNLFSYVDGTTACPPSTISISTPSNNKDAAPVIITRHWNELTPLIHPPKSIQLLKLQMKPDESSSAYLTRTQEYADALANISEPMKEKDVVVLLLSGLREKYNGFKSTILSRQTLIAFVDLHALLLDHDYMISNRLAHRKPTSQISQIIVGIYLKTIDPTIEDMETSTTEIKVWRRSSTVSLPEPGPKHHSTTVCKFYRLQLTSFKYFDHEYRFDHHVASNLSGFDHSKAYYGEDNLRVGIGTSLPILHIGSSSFHSPNKTFNLKRILHVPSITQNLLSVQQFCLDNNVYFEFHANFFCVKDASTHKILHTGPSNGGLYFFNFSNAQLKVSFCTCHASSTIWHHRLGHPHPQLLHSMCSRYRLPLSNNCSSVFCDSCSIGKSTKLSLSSSNIKSNNILDLMFCDVWGPTPAVYADGHRYFLLCVDHFTKYMCFFPLKQNQTFFILLNNFS